MVQDPNSLRFIEVKAKEKGLKSKVSKGMKSAMENVGMTEGNLLDHKLNRLETGQTNINYKLDEIINFLTALDSKMSDVMNKIRDLDGNIGDLKRDIESIRGK